MAKLEFDDDFSRLMEEFNLSTGAVERRRRITDALGLQPGMRILDVGSGPGHQIAEMAQVIGASGHIDGVDSSQGAVEIARRRCNGLANVTVTLGDAYDVPFEVETFHAAMSSQVFEYLDDVSKALSEMYRVLKPGARVLIHGTGWGALLWHSKKPERMSRILEIWDGHLADPKLCETMAKKLGDAGFIRVQAQPVIHVETQYESNSLSAVLAKFIAGYVTSQGITQIEADAWEAELPILGAGGDYFFSSNEYIFTGEKA